MISPLFGAYRHFKEKIRFFVAEPQRTGIRLGSYQRIPISLQPSRPDDRSEFSNSFPTTRKELRDSREHVVVNQILNQLLFGALALGFAVGGSQIAQMGEAQFSVGKAFAGT